MLDMTDKTHFLQYMPLCFAQLNLQLCKLLLTRKEVCKCLTPEGLKPAVSQREQNDTKASLCQRNTKFQTFEFRSKNSMGKFSLLHSILWKTMMTCLDFLGLSSNLDASHTQLAETFCKILAYPRNILDKWELYILHCSCQNNINQSQTLVTLTLQVKISLLTLTLKRANDFLQQNRWNKT